MSTTEKERARRRRAQARGTCPGCNAPIDLVCFRCASAICRRCGQLTGNLYTRVCESCRKEHAS